MDRRAYTFKVGQLVFYHAKGRRNRTGPYTIVGLARQSDGRTLYRIRDSAEEHLANADELKLSLLRPTADN